MLYACLVILLFKMELVEKNICGLIKSLLFLISYLRKYLA